MNDFRLTEYDIVREDGIYLSKNVIWPRKDDNCMKEDDIGLRKGDIYLWKDDIVCVIIWDTYF